MQVGWKLDEVETTARRRRGHIKLQKPTSLINCHLDQHDQSPHLKLRRTCYLPPSEAQHRKFGNHTTIAIRMHFFHSFTCNILKHKIIMFIISIKLSFTSESSFDGSFWMEVWVQGQPGWDPRRQHRSNRSSKSPRKSSWSLSTTQHQIICCLLNCAQGPIQCLNQINNHSLNQGIINQI